MTTYNTGNPIGSTDPRDLSDNSENFDNAVNNTASANWTDRFGVSRVSLAAQVGYIGTGVGGAIESYSAGLLMGTYNTIILYSGEFYRPSASATLPYTTTATLPDVDSNLVSVGDATLRQDLASNPSTGGGALLVEGVVQRVSSRTEMKAYDVPTGYQFSLAEGGRSGLFEVKTGSPPADTQEGIYIVLTNGNYAERINKTFLTPEMFGVVGDGIVDDTTAMKAAASTGTFVIGKNGSNYRLTEGIYLSDNTVFNLNGSSLQFYVIGEERCLVLDGSNTEVFNGTVINNTVEGGLSGDFQTPVMIGSLRDGLARTNCIVRNLFVDTKQPNGRCIIGYGDISNVLIQNIEAPSSTNIGRIVAIHWGSLGVAPVAQTFHSHNIKIENIFCEGLFNASSDAGVIFLSGAYDVDVSNIYGKEVPDGYIVRVFCGDYGYQYAQTITEKELAGQGIRLNNLYGKARRVVQVGMANPSGDVAQEWPVQVNVSGAGAEGYGSSDTSSIGVFTVDCSNVYVEGNTFDGFYYGVFPSVRSKKTTIRNNVFKNSVQSGIECRGTLGSETKVLRIRDNAFESSGVYDIYAEFADDVLIDGNEFNSPLAARSVFADSTNKPTNMKVTNNHVISCSATPFVFGAGATVNCCVLFNGNTLDDALAFNIKGGQENVPYALTSGRNSAALQKAYFSDRAPLFEPSEVGDIVWNTGAAASGFSGWICVTAGTPGTWKTFGVISA
jgi:hypothetical protein